MKQMLEVTPIFVTNKIDNYHFDQNAQHLAEQFIRALSELESDRNVESMVDLFADDCEVGDIAAPKLFRGIEGARRFWTNYRDKFKEVCSIFQKELYSDNKARLEWITEGKIKNGTKVKYAAVSILEIESDKIAYFHSYFTQQHPPNKLITGYPPNS